MVKNKVLIDTSMWKALLDEHDDFYSDAIRIWQRLKEENAPLVCSNYLLDETFTLLRIRVGMRVVEALRQLLIDPPGIKIFRATISDEKDAWDWFVNDWKGLSFTDCVSFAMMKRMGLTRVVTFDKHFQRAGFKVEG